MRLFSARAFALAAITAAALIIASCSALPSNAAANTVTLKATLTGAAEGSQPGNPNGSGSATIALNDTAQTVCYSITVSGIGQATAAHIHKGAAGQSGPIVVPLGAPTNGSAQGCTNNVNPDTIRAIEQNPAGYYVNVHTAAYPNGAIRGQLSR